MRHLYNRTSLTWTLYFHKLGMKFTTRRLQRKLTRLQKHLKLVEQKKFRLLQSWARAEKSLQLLQDQNQQSLEHLPPELRTLENYLEAKKQAEQESQDLLKRMLSQQAQRQQELQAIQEQLGLMQKSLPSSMLRQQGSTNEQSKVSEPKP